MSYHLILLRDNANIIGIDNKLGYRISEDLQSFQKITQECSPGKYNGVIMGRLTWESLPPQSQPLPNRLNVILSQSSENLSNLKKHESELILVRSNLSSVITELQLRPDIDQIFIIGGGQIYQQALKINDIDKIYITQVDSNLANEFDDNENQIIYGPYLGSQYSPISSGKLQTSSGKIYCKNSKYEIKNLNYRFMIYQNTQKISSQKKHPEYQYLDLLRKVITTGHRRETRNAFTYSIFGHRMEFDLSQQIIPILTTKRVAIKTAIKELLWFISGDTSNETLQKNGVHIWDGNSSREYLDSLGMTTRKEGDLGPVYGFQWRHSGAKYVDSQTDYQGQGVDQLQQAVKMLQTDPHNRRNIVCAWNPSDLSEMALPPCHLMFQWYVEENNRLSLQMYQRSGDSFLGIPFNIASYSMLIHMVAWVTGLTPGRFIHIIGDFHAYEDHLEAIQEQLEREPYPFPTVHFKRPISSIDDFKLEDIEIRDYLCHKTIKANMVV